MPEDHCVSLMPNARLRNAAALVGLMALSYFTSAEVRPARSNAVMVREPVASVMDAGPVWVSQATWDATEERIVIADPGSGRIYLYDTEGRIQRRIVNPGRGPLEFTKPNYPALRGGRYLIATSPYRWLSFDQDFQAQTAWELDWEEGVGAVSRMDTFEFDFSDTHLYTIGATMSFKGQWSGKGVYAVSLKDRTVQQLSRFPKDPEETNYYNEPPFNLSYCSGKVWLLEMASTVSIVEAREGGKRLRSFPPEFQRRAPLPPLLDASSLAARRAALRNGAVADGLFCADERFLLLLAHRPAAQGRLQWLVYPIDPSRDTMGRPIELPTSAGEIVFVPGRKRWAVLEKGPMKYVGVQPLTRLISFSRPPLSTVRETTAP